MGVKAAVNNTEKKRLKLKNVVMSECAKKATPHEI